MMKIEEMIAVISDLPVDERAKAVDQILKTFNQSIPEIEEAWIEEVHRRKEQVDTGQVELIPGEVVKKKIEDRFYK